MKETLRSDHPKQQLLFFVAQPVDDVIRCKVRDLVLRLVSLRKWVNGPPRFVDSRQQLRNLKSLETLGAYIELYSALPPWKLPREIDVQHLDEVTALVNELCAFSKEHKIDFQLELNRDNVGAINDGEMDPSLSVGLLGEWRRALGLST